MLKLIILDWDDCITKGSSEGYYACYEAAIAQVGIKKTPDEVRKVVRNLWGRPHREVIASIIGTDSALLDVASREYEKLIFGDTFSSHLTLISEVREKLKELRNIYQLAIATGMDGALFREHILPRFGMENFFSCIVSSSELLNPSRGKPYPDMLLKILESLSIKPEEAVMVGDAKGDVLMAQAARVRPIVVLTGQLTREEAAWLGVQYVISDVSMLQPLVSSL